MNRSKTLIRAQPTTCLENLILIEATPAAFEVLPC